VQVQGISGGFIAQQNWYAPSLVDPQQAGLQAWSMADITQLFREGRTGSSQVSGPMAEVVQHSTSYWSESDLLALATYLKDLPPVSEAPAPGVAGVPSAGEGTAQGLTGAASLYERHCSRCHGQDGKGVPNAYPALARSRTVNLPASVNLVQLVLKGGFSATTAGNPRPFGMPPFATSLSDGEIAAVLTYVRSAWGNNASPVLAQDVDRLRQHKN
jgi:mono/diheme cytochrome c family protein